MDLSQLLFTRLSADRELAALLAEYDGQPAIFNTEFPSDQQEGWGGMTQYPRIEYQFNMQADAQRASSGMLMLALYTEKNPMVAEQIEACVRRSFKDVLMKPSGEAPFCMSWARTDPYLLEGTAILCKDLVFDILEYPDQYTTCPDPVQSLALWIKSFFPGMFVLGIDEIDQLLVATEDDPVIYVRNDDIEIDHNTMALTWINVRLAIHVIAPTPDSRSKWARCLTNALFMAGEIPMTDGSPMRFTGVRAVTRADYLKNGQITVNCQYILPRIEVIENPLKEINYNGR